MNLRHRAAALAILAGGVLSCGAQPALALDTVRAVKAASVAWTFTVLDVGMAEGIFQKYDISVDISSAGGDAKVQQALAATASISASARPVDGVRAEGRAGDSGGGVRRAAAQHRDPRRRRFADQTVQDLKGKTLAVTTTGSLTEWLAQQMAIQEGWGQDGIKTAALGTFDASFAALEAHQVDGIVAATEAGYRLEEKNSGRNLIGLEKYAPNSSRTSSSRARPW